MIMLINDNQHTFPLVELIMRDPQWWFTADSDG